MNKEQTHHHITQSIINASLLKSNLNNEILLINGQTSEKIKHFLNNILYNEANYLEIGILQGSTLVASLFNNKVNSAYAIDIDNTNTELILSYKNKFNLDFKYFVEDSFKLNLNKIDNKINVYFYDGGHTFDDHYKSLEYYYTILDDEFIFIVDDWVNVNDKYYYDWEHVSKATRKAIKDLDLKIIYEEEKLKTEGWHGGFWISLLKKS